MNKSELTDILLADLCDRTQGPLTQEQIADAIGLTQPGVRLIEKAAIQKLKDAVRQAELYNPELNDILSHLGTGDGN